MYIYCAATILYICLYIRPSRNNFSELDFFIGLPRRRRRVIVIIFSRRRRRR